MESPKENLPKFRGFVNKDGTNKINNSTQQSTEKTKFGSWEKFAVVFFVFCIVIIFYAKVLSPKKENSRTSESEVKSNNANVNSVGNTTTYYKCDICNTTITGKGYCEGNDGVWRPLTDADNTLPYICSYSCAMKKKQQIDAAFKKVDEILKTQDDGKICTWCGSGRYQNGFCNMCGAASKSAVNEHKAKMPECSLCNGTGKLYGVGVNTGGTEICPRCNGSGKETY